MKLYLTGAKVPQTRQGDPVLSLGDYPSTSLIQNDVLNNLFSSISPFTREKGRAEHRLIALKNETASAVTNIEVHFNTDEDAQVNFLVGAIQPSTDDDNNPIFEAIQTSSEKPSWITFFSAEGEGNKVNLGNLNSGAFLGIWIRRELDAEPLSNQDIIDGKGKEMEVKVDFVISWD